jgi:SNF2 family DNA or RNA helicase
LTDATTTDGRVQAALVGSPPRVVLTPSRVPRPAWYEIGLVFDVVSSSRDAVLQIDLDVFLRGRSRLSACLTDYSVDFAADAGVTELLTRGGRDGADLIEALVASGLEEELNLSELLAGEHFALKRVLKDFQLTDVSALYRLAHGANFSVPGAGKTTVAYVLHALEHARGKVDKLLVVAPISAFDSWAEEANEVLSPAPSVERMTSNSVPGSNVVLVNYQRLPSSLASLSQWMLTNRVHLVIDEAHRAKRGNQGEWGRVLAALAPLATRRDILTGTPAPNHPRDLVALLDLLWPSGRASIQIPRPALVATPSPQAVASVHAAIAPLFVRTSKSRLDLPDVDIQPMIVPMGDRQREIYDALLNRYAGSLALGRQDAATFARMGEIAMHLIQAASSPRLLTRGIVPAAAYEYPSAAIPSNSSLAGLVENYRAHEMPEKFKAVASIVDENARNGRKTLVWSNFPANLRDLKEQFSVLQPAIVWGGIPSDPAADAAEFTRENELSRFRSDPASMVLLANPAALAEGVSLHHVCHDAVYMDRTFNAGQYLQSLDRIHRLGLAPEVVTKITILISPNTIDDRIDRRVAEKVVRLSQMLSDPHLVQMALPDDDDTVEYLEDPTDFEEMLDYLRSSGG